MESQFSEHNNQPKEMERLIQKIQEKVGELLKQDGKPIKFYPSFPSSLIASYTFEPPMEIGGISTSAPQSLPEKVKAKLVINRTPAKGVTPKDILLIVGILDDDLEDASFTLALKKGRPPSFQYHRKPREAGGNRFDVREARRTDMEDFIGIIYGDLYVITPKEIKKDET